MPTGNGCTLSPLPIVQLVGHFDQPYNNAIAAARTCYSSRVITPEDVDKNEKTRAQRDAIAASIYQAGHHTVLQHAMFQFVLDKVSRQFIWSFLHSHPYYNSEQVSQRYVEVKPENFVVPPLDDDARATYLSAIDAQMRGYQRLIEMLVPTVETEFFRIFPTRRRRADVYEKEIRKKAQEVARYVLPVATHAHLYHTISGITLHRYHRLCEELDVPVEQRLVVEQMVEEVDRIDPLFFQKIEDVIPLDQTIEYRALTALQGQISHDGNRAFIREFDADLGGYTSKLIDWKVNGEATLAQAVRSVLGLPRDRLSDQTAIDLVLNPARNPYLGETLNLSSHSKLMRVLVHLHYTFRKRLSHTADSQDQRHRTTPASRPVLLAHFSDTPDYITPALIRANGQAEALYQHVMEAAWAAIRRLLDRQVRREWVAYLLPNAFALRFEESGDLAGLHHKWVQRLCYNAQEEIFTCSKEEVLQVARVNPLIATFLAAPCGLRVGARTIPYCPEGKRFCGIPVWKIPVADYTRLI